MAIRDHLNGLWSDEDFEEWYPRDGRPGLSPAQLATVSVLQFLLELSDRQAAESVRNRIDFKYALAMDLEDPGFHHGVLADFRDGEQLQALRQIFVQNYHLDADDRPKWREPEDAGLPHSAIAIVSPYDISARYARRGETRWKGCLAHVTETCDQDSPNVITDVTTTKAPVHDTNALPGILTNLEDRNLLSKEHFVDGGYLSVALKQQVAREHGVGLVGPILARSTRQSRKGTVFHREAFTIDWDAQQVTCPRARSAAGGRHRPRSPPTSTPSSPRTTAASVP
ncbi:transposase [Actinacidiphila guanduensis]|nr:transposase [Actinacidiphila guanduensis]